MTTALAILFALASVFCLCVLIWILKDGYYYWKDEKINVIYCALGFLLSAGMAYIFFNLSH